MAGQRSIIFTLLDLIVLGIGTAAPRDGFVDVDWHRVVFMELLFEAYEAGQSDRLHPRVRLSAIAEGRLWRQGIG